MEFIAKSNYLKQVKRVAEKSARLKISLYIWGEEGTGKTFLANYIGKIAPIKPLLLEEGDLKQFYYTNREQSGFIVATGTIPFAQLQFKSLFETDLHLLSLSNHLEDLPAFIDHFLRQGVQELRISRQFPFKRPTFVPDLSQNLHSLKRQVYRYLLTPTDLTQLEECASNFYTTSPKFSWQEMERSFTKGILKGARQIYSTKVEISKQLKFNRVTLIRRMKELLGE